VCACEALCKHGREEGDQPSCAPLLPGLTQKVHLAGSLSGDGLTLRGMGCVGEVSKARTWQGADSSTVPSSSSMRVRSHSTCRPIGSQGSGGGAVANEAQVSMDK